MNHSSDIDFKDFISSIENVQLNHILFLLMILHSHQIILEKIFFASIIKMTINDQIKNGKLQYDINREAAKIFALSSGKIREYKYLTGEDILPSNQQQIIERAKFTYSPLGKAFEKQTRTIEDQGEKQIKAIQNQTQVKTIKKYVYEDDDTLFISKPEEIFNELVDERLEKITDLDKKKLIVMI